MASRWADHLPLVSIGKAETPKPVTLVIPYYENPLFFEQQWDEFWHACPVHLRSYVNAIVVDDGSRTPAVLPTSTPFPMRLFRIHQDVPWNWLAARNIGAHHAPDGWILFTDMDHVIPEATFIRLIEGAHVERFAYAFRRRESTGEVIPPHSASFLMTRQTFWRTGGYDEVLSGHYGTDGDFRRRLAKVAPIQVLTDELIRYEAVADASTIRYRRKLPEDAVAVAALVKARGANWTPKVLSFPYHEVSVEAPCSA